MIAIRVDMNNSIATGHMMRCLAIADALRERGVSVIFILADEQATELLSTHGYEYIVLHTAWNKMESEIPKLQAYLEGYPIEKVLIDSYQVTEKYLEELSVLMSTVYLDDLNMFDYHVDTLVCYANYWMKFNYQENQTSTHFLLGTEYTPLRKAFWNCENKEISDKVSELLILAGGSDPYDATGKILEQLVLEEYNRVNVICGRYNENYQRLKKAYLDSSEVVVQQAVDDIEEYMKRADVVISAGGTTLYELCAVGTPTISYAFADNQLDNVMQFAEDDLIDYAGDIRKDDIGDQIRFYLTRYQKDKELREVRSRRMQELVDGQGAMRIAKALIEVERRKK